LGDFVRCSNGHSLLVKGSNQCGHDYTPVRRALLS
jgi:hypothetical protein